MAGFWDRILGRNQPIAVYSPRVEYVGGAADLPGALMTEAGNLSVSKLWLTQPHLRTVVSFLARNVAQLGVHVFERVDEADRRRDRESPAARALAYPDGVMTTYDLIYALVGDMCLYDRAFWFIGASTNTPSGLMIRRLPPSWVSVEQSDPFTVSSYAVGMDGRNVVSVPAENILAFTGYSPTSPLKGSPTIESLRAVLFEQVEAARYRGQVWKRGGRVSAVLQRPKDAPQWSAEAREAFREDWYAKYTGDGPKAGGTPLLEDGMTLNRIDFTAQEQQFVEAAKLSQATVAAAFHVNPTMIGMLDNANYSNVREFRRMLYGDTLGPMLAQIEARINTFLLPRLGMDQARFYAEFNIAEKLQGSFEEQAAVMSTLVGRPIMTGDEGRAKFNLPALGGDMGLVATPLNVLIGGQASPRDSGSQNRSSVGPLQVKAAPSDPQRAKAEQVMRAFFARQEKVVRSRLGAKAADWWDQDRWDSELADDMLALSVSVSEQVGQSTAKALGFAEGDYDIDRTLAFLKAVTERRASAVNAATEAQLQAALDSDDPTGQIDSVWTVAQEQRSPAAGAALTAMAAGFATTEAARQNVGDQATKTWETGPNPRKDHADMDGETVGIDDVFSNGLQWPGEGGDPDQVAGCNCSVTIGVP